MKEVLKPLCYVINVISERVLYFLGLYKAVTHRMSSLYLSPDDYGISQFQRESMNYISSLGGCPLDQFGN